MATERRAEERTWLGVDDIGVAHILRELPAGRDVVPTYCGLQIPATPTPATWAEVSEAGTRVCIECRRRVWR